jgi:molybdate-binding protein
MVQEGKADCCFGLASIAAQFKLGFVPLARERFDLLDGPQGLVRPAVAGAAGVSAGQRRLPPAQEKWPATM